MTQGYCTPVFNAFKQAGKGDVPATCYGYNGEIGACAQSGRACAVLSGSPVVMQIGMKLALDKLRDGSTAEEQVGSGADDAVHHAHSEGRPQRVSRQCRIDQGREELLPQPSRWSCSPVYVAGIQDHPEPGSWEIAEQSRGN